MSRTQGKVQQDKLPYGSVYHSGKDETTHYANRTLSEMMSGAWSQMQLVIDRIKYQRIRDV